MDKNKPIIKHLPDFLDYLEIEKGLSDKTQKNYARFLHDFFKWLENNRLKNLSPAKLTANHIWQYRVHLSRSLSEKTKTSLKKSTQNLYLISLRALLEYFVERKIPSLSPTAVKLAKDKADKEVKFLNLEQIERLLLSPDVNTKIGLRDRAILETLFSTGLRVEELTNLNRDQIKISSRGKELEVVVTGKGEKIRTVYFSERAVYWLGKYLAGRNDLDEALFINYWRAAGANASRRLSTKSIDDIVKKYARIAGIQILATPHTIRHSFATDLLSQGVDLRLVQEFLGHQSITTTQIYTHVTKKQLRDIHHKLHGGRKLKG